MSVGYEYCICCNQWMLHLLQPMFAAYELLLHMNVEFLATDICCDQCLLCMNVAIVVINVCYI